MKLRWTRKIESAKSPYDNGVITSENPETELERMIPANGQKILLQVRDSNENSWKGFVTYRLNNKIERVDLWKI